jgi:hypothetical protein
MDTELKMSTREEAEAAVRALQAHWGSEFVLKVVVQKKLAYRNALFALSDLETMRVWNWLHDLIPRGR